jgi:predicted ATPase/class 3 adenylate cyclase
MQAPDGNVTFLFTDIERSSQLWEIHPQAMGRALAQHDELVREVLIEHRGYIFKTMGDAFCVAFASALDAANAAVEAQRKLGSATWEETGPLRVRIALHSGEAEQRDGDYFGQTLNRVARVLSAGHGGQTLLSRVTAERVREELPEGVSLRDLGERRLKDLSKPERIFQIVTGDLPTDFPPLRSLEVLPNNLPAQVTTFVGRTREMAEVKRLLDTTRMLTLTGPGGTGKTRLSLQVAAEVLDRFPHGVWLVELATISDSVLVAEAIANAVDIREEAGRPPVDTIADALRARRLLLILDNCEHLIAPCAQIAAALLRRCPELIILASSREPLSIDGETIWSVPPLAVPEFRRQEPGTEFDNLPELEAVQLFVERASSVRPDFSLTPDNVRIVAQICSRLDGIPLAIELAAARVKVLSLQQIFTRLDDRFRLLSAGSRSAQPRQQTLGSLIDWSYDLLTESERALFRRLAVFVVGRTVEMAEEVCTGDGVEIADVFDLLYALVDKSLVMIEPGHDGESRYTMLESLWDYADEKLIQLRETEKYRTRHLDYFVRFAEEAEAELMGPDQVRVLERLSTEHYNMNYALRWSLESDDRIERGLRLAGALTRYWEVRSYLTEGREQFEDLLRRADASIPASVRAKAARGAGRLAWCQDRDEDALRYYGEAQRLFEELRMPVDAAFVAAFRGFTERNEGNNDAARVLFEHAKGVGEAERSDRLIATALSGLGSIATDEGDFVRAREMKERSLAIFRESGDKWIIGLVTWSLAKACISERDFDSARRYLSESIALSRELGNKWSVPYALESLADICTAENRGAKAVRLYGAASTQREALGLAFPPAEKLSYEKAIKALHELVPEKQFESEWSAGRTLTAQAAINFALEAERNEPRTPRKRRQNPTAKTE